MNKQTNSLGQKRGFTIIEVVLVLAIAGLIFLMVFIALPTLQKAQRDTQRRNDLSRIQTQLTAYAGSTRGKLPGNTDDTMLKGFVSGYLSGTGTSAGDDYQDPTTGSGYVVKLAGTSTATNSDLTVGQISYRNAALCADDGSGAFVAAGTNTRQYALAIKLENQTAPYCIDNR